MARQYVVEISSELSQFVNRLEKFDKEVSKELKKSMRDGANYVVKAAVALVPAPPLTNWGAYSWIEQDRAEARNLNYNQAKAKRSIKAATYRARKRGATVAFGYIAVQKDPAASIYETAGAKTPGAPFNRALVSAGHASGPWPRIMFPAYYEGMPQARAEIEQALQDARKKVGL